MTLGQILWPDLGAEIETWVDLANQARASVSPAALGEEGFQGADLGRVLRERQLQAIAAVRS